jgi:hypothetical protein
MIVTRENRDSRRKISPSVTLSTINLTRTGPESKPGLLVKPLTFDQVVVIRNGTAPAGTLHSNGQVL